ncbi:MAG: hypothetical protein HY909_01310 [Deltaproteobacteria bacterium]|nr:hypothetical protein [Deltaproteobacteria bacterium]
MRAVVVLSLAALAACVRPPEELARVAATEPVAVHSRSVLTQRYGNERLGLYSAERVLTPATVAEGSFGKLYERVVPGWVTTQPLYVPGLLLPGEERPREVVYVGTSQNRVFAFDAGNGNPYLGQPGPHGASLTGLLWASERLGDPWFGGALELDGPTRGFQREPYTQNRGILSTPVVDLQRRRIYAVSTVDGARDGAQRGMLNHFRLYALDLATGQPRDGTPVALDGAAASRFAGTTVFDPRLQAQRASLLRVGAHLLVAFGARGDDFRGFHGWLWVFDLNNLAQGPTDVHCTTPGDDPHFDNGGGIWQAGSGPAATPDGDLFYATGNALVDNPREFHHQAPRHEEQSVVRARIEAGRLVVLGRFFPGDTLTTENPRDRSPGPGGGGPTLAGVDLRRSRAPREYARYTAANPPGECSGNFAPIDGAAPRSFFQTMELGDTDYASGGVTLLPGGAHGTLLSGGKPGIFYLLPARLTGVTSEALQSFQATNDVWNLQRPAYCYATRWNLGPHIHGQPAWLPPQPWSRPGTPGHLFVWGERDVLRDYPYDPTEGRFRLDQTPPLGAIPSGPAAMPGGNVVVSWNGLSHDSAVVWATLQESEDLCRCAGHQTLFVPAAGLVPGAGGQWCAANVAPFSARSPTMSQDDGNCHGYGSPGRVYAFDARDLPRRRGGLLAARALWSDTIKRHARFVTPTVADGRLYVPTFDNRFNAYGTGVLPLRREGAPVAFVRELAGVSQQLLAFTAVDGAGLTLSWWHNQPEEHSYFPGGVADAWHPWQRVPDTRDAAAGQRLAPVLSGLPSARRLDLPFVTREGRVVNAFWSLDRDRGAWRSEVLGDAGFAAPGASVAAGLGGGPGGSVGLYVVAPDGTVRATARRVGADRWDPWSTVASLPRLSQATTLTVIPYNDDQWALTLVDGAGALWWAPRQGAPRALVEGLAPGQRVAAVRASGAGSKVELFASDPDGVLRWCSVAVGPGDTAPAVRSCLALASGVPGAAVHAEGAAGGELELWYADREGVVWQRRASPDGPLGLTFAPAVAVSGPGTARPDRPLAGFAAVDNGPAMVFGVAMATGGPVGENPFVGAHRSSDGWTPWFNAWLGTPPPHPTLLRPPRP